MHGIFQNLLFSSFWNIGTPGRKGMCVNLNSYQIKGALVLFTPQWETPSALCVKQRKAPTLQDMGKISENILGQVQVRFSRRKMNNVEFPRILIGNVDIPGAIEFPPKYEARRK